MDVDLEQVERLRTEQGLTQAQAAKKGGLRGGKQQWSDVVTGRAGQARGISLPTLEKIAKALGVRAKDLLK